MEDRTHLILPEDSRLVEALVLKAEEYKGRLAGPLKNPINERKSGEKAILEYRVALFERLFEKGELDTTEFASELGSGNGNFNWIAYNQAIDVVWAYCTGRVTLRGGTGLRIG